MDQSIKHADQSFGEDQFPSSESKQRQMPAPLQGQLAPSHKKPGRRLFTKKGALYLGLALLTIVVILGADFLLIPRPTTKWSYQPDILHPSSFSEPIVSNGMVYTLFASSGLESNTIYAFDANSGQVRWSHNIDSFISSSPILANGILYVWFDDSIDKSGTLYALDATSGQEKWSFQQNSLLSSPTIANGIVYIDSNDGNLFALDALSGHQIWTEQVGDYFFTAPLILANNMVYIATSDQATKESTVFALDAATGHKKWSTLEATPLIGSLTVANGLVYIAADDTSAQVSALDAFSGDTKWSTSVRESILAVSLSLQVVNGMAYVDYEGVNVNGVSGGAPALYALDARTGHQVWTEQSFYLEPTIANGKVYVYSADGNLSALEALSGRKQWSHKAVPFDDLSLSIKPEPTVVNGTVYVRTNGFNENTPYGAVYALDALSGKEQWSYQPGGYFSTSPTVVKGIVYVSINNNQEAIQPPGGAPGFSR